MSDPWHLHTVCPKCQGQVRHRLLVAALRTREDVGEKRSVSGKDVLHFAPEEFLSVSLRRLARRYVTSDYLRPDVDFQLDLSNMSSIDDADFDLLIACDVLEHVPDHTAALREIHRVLRRDGLAILSVPQPDDLKTTFEDPAIVDPKEREKHFGQWDHLRLYGEDFARGVEAHGFDVVTIAAADFPPALIRKHVLAPPVLSRVKNATNQRRIYFARKR